MQVFRDCGKRAWILAGLGLIALMVAVPAYAAKPTRTALPLVPLELVPGMACPFAVNSTPLPGSTLTETDFSDGTALITSQGQERLTNVETGESIVENVSGTIRIEFDAAGNVVLTTTGHADFFFFPGDAGPFGTTGANGGLYHIVGRATEIINQEGLITSFTWSGQATELCSLIS